MACFSVTTFPLDFIKKSAHIFAFTPLDLGGELALTGQKCSFCEGFINLCITIFFCLNSGEKKLY